MVTNEFSREEDGLPPRCPLPIADGAADGGGEELRAAEILVATDEAIDAEIVFPPSAEAGASRPQPGLLLAIVWSALPFVAQVGVGAIVFAGLAVLVHLQQGGAGRLDHTLEALNFLLLPIGTATTLAVALAVVGIGYGRHAARRIGWRNCASHQWIATVLLVAPLAIIASEVGNWTTALLDRVGPLWLQDFRESSGELFDGFVQQSWWLVFLGGCLLPGLGEEIYCRGFIGRGLLARYGGLGGAVLTSLLFAAMHIEPVQASSAFVLGLGLQSLFLLTRALPTAVTLHTLNNFAAFLVMRYEDLIRIPGVSTPAGGELIHTPPLLVAAAICALAALIAFLYQTRTRWRLPDGSVWSPGYAGGESPPAGVNAQAWSPRPSLFVAASVAVTYLGLIGGLLAVHASSAN